MQRRAFMQYALCAAATGSPQVFAAQKPGADVSQTSIADTNLALASKSATGPARAIINLPEIVLNSELERSSEVMLGLIHHLRLTELGYSLNPDDLPKMLNTAGVSMNALAVALESSGLANEINAMLLEEGPLGFHKLRSPSDELCRQVSEMIAQYQPPNGLPPVDMSLERIRQLNTVYLTTEEATALHVHLLGGGSFTDYLRDGTRFMLESAQALQTAGLQLPRVPSRSRQQPLRLSVESKAERDKKIVNAFINGLSLAAAGAGFVCFLTAGAGCLVAAILALNAAGVRFLVSIK